MSDLRYQVLTVGDRGRCLEPRMRETISDGRRVKREEEIRAQEGRRIDDEG